MTKRHLEQLIADGVDTPDAEERERVAEELRGLPECDRLLASHRRLHELFDGIESPTLERSVAREVIAELRRTPVRRHNTVPAYFWAGVCTACIALVLGIGLLLRVGGTRQVISPGPLRAARPVAQQPAEPLSSSLCAREHARLAAGCATTDRAAWAVALVESNQKLLR